MSHAIVRGEPSAAQLYLDGVLDSILEERGVDRDAAHRASLSLAQVLFYCMKRQRDAEFMTNGSTGEIMITNQLLKNSVALARSLLMRGVSGKTVVVVMRNHQRTAALYFALLFAGVVPFFMDPNGTAYEFKYFLELIEPCFVFCDREHYSDVTSCLEGNDRVSADVIVAEDEQVLLHFASGASDDVDSFQVQYTEPDVTIMMIPTSGSTGLPKAAVMTNKGFVMQLPSSWSMYTKFPTPTKRMFISSTSRASTFTVMMTTCVVYQIPLVMSPKATPEHIAGLFLKFRPTWTFFSPIFMKLLLPAITSEHLSSLESLLLIGTASTPDIFSAIKEKLPETTHLYDSYGATETHGYTAIQDRDSPCYSNGRVLNIMHYKLVNDDGQEVGLCQQGELCIKGDSLIKGYYKDQLSYKDSFTPDGWYHTGDVFYIDENEQLFYRERKKFTFKFLAYSVAPEEVERVISSVPGVRECVVCGTDKGPTAAVVLGDGCDVTKEQIHHAVNSALSNHKRLHGGVAFITSLPQTQSGKLQRGDCLKLIKQLMESGQCF